MAKVLKYEKTILRRTGMSQSSYSKARDWLDKNYFITYKKGCHDATIKVNYAYLWGEVNTETVEDYIERQDSSSDSEETRQAVVVGNQVWTWDKFNYFKEKDYFSKSRLDESYIKHQLEEYLSAPAEK